MKAVNLVVASEVQGWEASTFDLSEPPTADSGIADTPRPTGSTLDSPIPNHELNSEPPRPDLAVGTSPTGPVPLSDAPTSSIRRTTSELEKQT